ncbi:MAG TPA: alanine racemase [Geobacteraceae bacterium]|nr:alanine racemase [Geobacteraceae bacterium]
MDSRPTIAEIDLSALRHNYLQIKNIVSGQCGILAVVKADAYGHGFMDVSMQLEKMGVTAFGVAFLAEGIQLRKAGIDRPILLLGGIYPGQEKKCIGFNISTVVFDIEQARALNYVAGKMYRKARVHLKVDTGMGRLGIFHEDVAAFLKEFGKMRHLELEGMISHFASADELDDNGNHFTEIQSGIFSGVVEIARNEGFSPRYIHLANSAAAFSQKLPFCNLIRPGIALYGALPSADFDGKMDLRPVMHLRSKVAMLKWVDTGNSVSYARRFVAESKTLVASVPVGYADGYSRALTNRGEALVRGMRAKVAGTVCMDWVMLDVTDIPDVAVGDVVTMLGCDGAGNCVRAEELAERSGTIPYEVFCNISKRVPRVYVGG